MSNITSVHPHPKTVAIQPVSLRADGASMPRNVRNMEIEVADPALSTRRRLSVAQAVASGIVAVRSDGRLTVPAASRHLVIRAVPRASAPAPVPAKRPADGFADRIVQVNRFLGKSSRWPMLASSALKIAQSPGTPAWQTLYFAANGVNRVLGGTWLPAWLTGGPVKVAIEGALLLPALQDSFTTIAEHRSGIRSVAASTSNVVASASNVVASAGKEAASATAHVAARANVPALAPLFKFIKPMYRAGMTMACLTGVLALPEYLAQHGTKGLLNTTSGRAAWMGAISSASMLAAMWLPTSPFQLYVDAASNVLWGAELVNGHGWLDALLGADRPASK